MLLAKPKKNGNCVSVFQHSQDVARCLKTLWPIVEPPLTSMIGAERTASLKQVLIFSAWGHDPGKANSAFQHHILMASKLDEGDPDFRKYDPDYQQPVRHEVVSALILTQPEVKDWLRETFTEREYWMGIFAILGHHLKVREAHAVYEPSRVRLASVPHPDNREISIYSGSEDVRRILEEMAAELGSSSAPVQELKDHLHDLQQLELPYEFRQAKHLNEILDSLCETSKRRWERYKSDPQFVYDLALAKGLLICSDVSGSIPEVFEDVRERITVPLRSRLAPEDLDPIIARGLNGHEPYDFQRRLGKTKKNAAIVLAGCGTGKTTAAYMWARIWALGLKLFFCYPTTITATEGFLPYLHPEKDTALIHMRMAVDIQNHLNSLTDWDEKDKNQAQREAESVLEAVNHWGPKIVSCTADTVLGCMQNNRRGILLLPAVLNSAIVFDEVHAYDEKMFATLLHFLKMFPHIPVLLMSASLSPHRVGALEEALGDRLDGVYTSDENQAEQTKYTLQWQSEWDALFERVQQTLENNGKVLWIANTVNRSRDIYTLLKIGLKEYRDKITLFHSRYRYEDRSDIQRKVVARLGKDSSEPHVVVATQVCEMSLDIGVDLLITENCPLPFAVQRLGRLGRWHQEGDTIKHGIVYPAEDNAPYTEPEWQPHFAVTESMAKDLNGGGCTQMDLDAYLKQASANEKYDDYTIEWLHGGWTSQPGSFRNPGHTITVIREEDAVVLAQQLDKKVNHLKTKEVIPVSVPMIQPQTLNLTQRIGPYFIAPAGTSQYDSEYGGRWGA